MQKNILIVTEIKGYLMLSLKERFEQDGYEVITMTADIDELSKVTEEIGGILIFADEHLVTQSQALVYLKDWAAEHDKPIFAIGSNDELAEITSIMTAPMISEKFIRPINVNDLVKAVDTFLKKFYSDNKKKILVVDDSGVMLRNVKAWLEDKYQVFLANSGAMAIKYLAINRPDLVLLDYEMPIVDGKQVLAMIRAEQEFADMPVIFLTSKDDKESVLQVMSLKPEGYLLKTMSPDKIKQTIDDFFEKRKGR
ncbi:MAG: response regulator [bacterium]|nr:response regulator [bacterium]